MAEIVDGSGDTPDDSGIGGDPGSLTARVAETSGSGDWFDSLAGTGNIAMRPGPRGAFFIHSEATFWSRLWRLIKMPFTYLFWGVIEI